MEEKNYEDIKREYQASTDNALVFWAKPYFTGEKKPDTKDVYIIGDVNERAAKDIKELTGSDIAGFRHVIRSDVVRHVQKRHGAHGNADRSMEDLNDLGRIGYILQNYDEIITDNKPMIGFKNKFNESAPVIQFVKRINGHVYTAEAVTDSPKRKTLYVVSMYKAKTSIKRELAACADSYESPLPYVQDETNSSISIIPQNEKNVKLPEEKKRKDFEAYRDKLKELPDMIEAKRAPEKSAKSGGK